MALEFQVVQLRFVDKLELKLLKFFGANEGQSKTYEFWLKNLNSYFISGSFLISASVLQKVYGFHGGGYLIIPGIILGFLSYLQSIAGFSGAFYKYKNSIYFQLAAGAHFVMLLLAIGYGANIVDVLSGAEKL